MRLLSKKSQDGSHLAQTLNEILPGFDSRHENLDICHFMIRYIAKIVFLGSICLSLRY
jgi:hypothetical protein